MVKIYNVIPFDPNSIECPMSLKIVLRQQLRELFPLRASFRGKSISNFALDKFIDGWYCHHRNIIKAASLRKEWNWSTLSLIFDKSVNRPVDLFHAKHDFLSLIGRLQSFHTMRSWKFKSDESPYTPAYADYYLGSNHDSLYLLFADAFDSIVLEGRKVSAKTSKSKDTSYISKDTAERFADMIRNNTDPDNPRSVICNFMADESRLGKFYGFNALPKAIFTYRKEKGDQAYVSLCDQFFEFVGEHRDDFFIDVVKSVGAHQISGKVGAVKTTVVNKLVKLYFNFLTAFTLGTPGNPLSVIETDTFEMHVEALKNAVTYLSDVEFKVRNSQAQGGYSLVNNGTFEQIFARLQEEVKGSLSNKSFIVSFHPCDMITCSFGYNWSSCQSFVDRFDIFQNNLYGRGSLGHDYSGMYNRGNFQFLSGNGFIAYIPYEKRPDLPQYLWAKSKRCLMWISDNLKVMRQNNFYPGKPTDQESIALAKSMREYIQNICAPFNNSNGTVDWLSVPPNKIYNRLREGNGIFTEYATYNDGRYDDPILSYSYLKGTTDETLFYAVDFPSFDTGRLGNTFFDDCRVCPICGARITSHQDYCNHCSEELIKYKDKYVHPSTLLYVNIDGVRTPLALDDFNVLDSLVINDVDGSYISSSSAIKVRMPDGIRYFKELPDNVKKCVVCGEYFHTSLMVGDVCLEHVSSALNQHIDINLDIDNLVSSFISKTLEFACDDTESLAHLLSILDNKDVLWMSGKKPSEFVPSSTNRFLSVNDDGKMVLSSQAKVSAISVKKLFMKGGE